MRLKKLLISLVIFTMSVFFVVSQGATPIPGVKTNIILDKPVFVSSSYSSAYPAMNAVDGNVATIWGTGVGNASDYIYADFGEPMKFDEVTIHWYDKYYATHYQIWVSDDASNWRQIADVTDGDGGVDSLKGEDTCRYFGILFLSRNSVAVGLTEIEVFRTKDTSGALVVPGNICLEKTVTASSMEGYEFRPEMAVDGIDDVTSRWASAETDDEWITVDLGERHLIETIEISWEKAFAFKYNVNLSDDGTNWTTVYSEESGDGGVDRITLDDDTPARYIQVQGVKRISIYGYSIYELRAYCDGYTPATPTPSPTPIPTATPPNYPVGNNGQLQVIGTKLCNEDGEPIWLRGMSSHGMQWFGDEINPESLDILAYDWQIDVIRLSLYAREGGYETNPDYWTEYMEKKIDMAIARGLYVLIDWHQLTPGDPWADVENAEIYLTHMANRYKDSPAVIYEICNEPNECAWDRVQTYAEYMIPKIRAIDPDAPIFVGTHGWGSLGISYGGSEQDIINNPVNHDNIMYTFHFYAASHGQRYRDAVEKFVAAGFPLFVTECGTQSATGDGYNDFASSDLYFDMFERLQIGFVNWNFSSDIRSGAVLQNAGDYTTLKEAGVYIKDKIQNPPSPWDN